MTKRSRVSIADPDVFIRTSDFVVPVIDFLDGPFDVAAFYNVWSGSQLVLTLVGWAQVSKALLYFCFPAVGMHGLRRVDPEKPGQFVAAGIGWLVIAGVVVFGWL